MKKRLLITTLVIVLLTLCVCPTISLAANYEISASGTYNLGDYTFSADDTLTIKEGLTVTLSGSATNISVVCEPNVNLTLNGVGITVTDTHQYSPIVFTGGTSNTLTISGTSTLTAQNNYAALQVEGSTALTINGSATLYATSFQGAAIGSSVFADCGIITIEGGNIDAQCGSNGAGIGGGGGRSNGTINITGGSVFASSGLRGAGIGGGGTDSGTGGSGGTINITGGSVEGKSMGANHGGAGIGGGVSDSGTGGSGGTISISGGTIIATGNSGGAGIGGGEGSTAGGAGAAVTISNKANVDATGSGTGYDLGGGGGAVSGAGGTLFIDGYSILRLRSKGTNAVVSVNSGTVTGASGGSLSGAYYNGTKLSGEIIDWGDPYLASGTGYTMVGSEGVIGNSGDYIIVGKKSLNYSTVTVNSGLTVNISLLNTYMYRDNGFAPLDIQDATAVVTLYGHTQLSCNDRPAIWLSPSSELTIQGSGSLTATSNLDAGIGSSTNQDNGKITIKSGTIIATGGYGAAGIGGGSDGEGGNITIEGGDITATGGTYASAGGAGIGGGAYSGGGSISITGGTVEANGGYKSAGVGGGGTTNTMYVGYGGTINISGGTVSATGGSNGAGIGGGNSGSGGSVMISGNAHVTASGGDSGAGIGGGINGGGGTISLSGGTVYAASGSGSGQDIGYGSGGSGGTLNLSGNAAAFLYKDISLAPVTTTHTHLTFTEDVEESYGIPIPSAWTPTFGAFLRIHTLSYNANGGSGTVPASVIKLYTETTSVMGGSGLTRDYYTFSGWNTAANGGGTNYSPDDTFTYNATTTLYAKWTPVSYTITYNLDDGTLSTPNPSSYTVESDTFTLNNPEKPGFTFMGWSQTGMDGTSMSVTIPKGSSGDRVYSATWQAKSITGIPTTQTMYVNGRITLNPEPSGGTWEWDKNFFSATFSSPATFTAKKAGTSVITYTVNGVSSSVTVTIQDTVLPSTGQDFTWVYALVLAAAILAGGAWVLVRRAGQRGNALIG